MKGDVISARQLYLLVFVALLSPAVALMPGVTAATAGGVAWVTGLVALVPLGAVLLLWRALLTGGGGMGQVLCRRLGVPLGRFLTILYVGWVAILLSVAAWRYGRRMAAMGFRNGSMTLFLVVLLAVVLWMGRGKCSAFARSGEICYLIIMVTLAVVLAFGLGGAEVERVWPVWGSDAPAILAATVVPVGLVSGAVVVTFLWGAVAKSEHRGRQAVAWLAVAGCVLTLLQYVVVGQLGAGLATVMPDPFFQVVRSVAVTGVFQRVEALVLAIWVLCDFVLLGLLVFSGRAMVETVWGETGSRWAPWVLVIAAFLGAQVLERVLGDDAGGLAFYIIGGNLVLGVVVPGLVLLLGRPIEG